jgi:hypothetical protein
MKTLIKVLLGLASALAFCIFEYVMAYIMLNPLNLGNYSDLIYVAASVLVLIWALVTERWVFAASFIFWAFCFYRPITLFIVGAIACLTGKCLII